MQPVGPSSFNAFYYANCCGKPYERNAEWLSEFGRLADRIVADMHPVRVLDAGCAIGLLVETLRDRGVDAWGIDISSFAIASADEHVRPYCREGSIAAPFDGRFDLITCIEVVEHMPPVEAERAIANICAHTDDVLFSSSPLDHREPTHINVNGPEHWAEMFARNGYIRDVDYDASFLTPWAARFRRSSAPLHRVVRDLERRAWQSSVAERDARAYAVEVQTRLAHAEAEVAHVRGVLDREVSELRRVVAQAESIAAQASAQAQEAIDAQARAEGEMRSTADALVAATGRAAQAEVRAAEAEAHAVGTPIAAVIRGLKRFLRLQ